MSVSNIDNTRKQGIKILIILGVVGIVVFFGYGPLFDLVGGGIPGRVLGATFGSIFAILMTMFLLNKQTEIEQESKKSERVFDEKVQLYKTILESAKNMLKDNQLDSKEMLALPFSLIQMQMVGGDEAIKVYTALFEKINDIYEADKNEVVEIPESKAHEVFSLLSRFSVQCRVDLGISDTPIDETIFARAITVLEQSNDAVKRKGQKVLLDEKVWLKSWEGKLSPESIQDLRRALEVIQSSSNYLKINFSMSDGASFYHPDTKRVCQRLNVWGKKDERKLSLYSLVKDFKHGYNTPQIPGFIVYRNEKEKIFASGRHGWGDFAVACPIENIDASSIEIFKALSQRNFELHEPSFNDKRNEIKEIDKKIKNGDQKTMDWVSEILDKEPYDFEL